MVQHAHRVSLLLTLICVLAATRLANEQVVAAAKDKRPTGEHRPNSERDDPGTPADRASAVTARIQKFAAKRDEFMASGRVVRRTVATKWPDLQQLAGPKPSFLTDAAWAQRKEKIREQVKKGPYRSRLEQTIYFAPGCLRVDTKSASWYESEPEKIQRSWRVAASNLAYYTRWSEDGEWIHLYHHDEVEQFGVDGRKPQRHAPTYIGRVTIYDPQRLTIGIVKHEGRACLRLEETLQKSGVRYVQTVDPNRGYTLLCREKYYDNSNRQFPLDDQHPFSVERFRWRHDDQADVWLPESVESTGYHLVRQLERKQPELRSREMADFVEVSFDEQPRATFRIEGLDLGPARGNVSTDWCVLDHRLDQVPANNPRARLRQPAPELSIAKWAGPEIEREDWRGRFVVLCFLGQWHSRSMLPELKAIQREYSAKSVAVIGIHSPTARLESIESVHRRLDLNFPIAVSRAHEETGAGLTLTVRANSQRCHLGEDTSAHAPDSGLARVCPTAVGSRHAN